MSVTGVGNDRKWGGRGGYRGCLFHGADRQTSGISADGSGN